MIHRAALLALAFLWAAVAAAAGPSMSVTPTVARGGEVETFRFVFQAGEEGLAEGGGFELVFYCQDKEQLDDLLWSCPKKPGKTGNGQVSASSPHVGVDLDLEIERPRTVRVLVADGSVPSGGTVELVYTGRVQAIARELRWHVRSRRGNAAGWTVLPEGARPVTRALPGPAVVVAAFAPADVLSGEPFDLAVAALDRWGNPAGDYRGTVTFSSTDSLAVLPGPYVFFEGDGGVHTFPGVRLMRPGLQRISISDDEPGTREEAANWSEVHTSEPDWRRWFGELQFHSGAGAGYDGWDSEGGDHKGNYARLDEGYRYARDVWRLDFAAATEHDTGLEDETWAAVIAVTETMNQPGRFTTFHGFEWTRRHRKPEGGHRCIIYGDQPGLVYNSRKKKWNTQTKLFAALREQAIPATVIPHMMRPDPDHHVWDVTDNLLQTLSEIYSYQNTTSVVGDDKTAFELEMPDAWAIRNGWLRGNVFGVVGSSDNHVATPGHHRFAGMEHSQDGGYAVALAEANDRDSIFRALRERRTYATSGIRALLAFEVDGLTVGRVVKGGSGPPHIRGYVAGTAPILRLHLFAAGFDRGFEDLEPADLDPRPEVFAFELEDGAWEKTGLYYIRAEQVDGEMVWSSPVWVVKRRERPGAFSAPGDPLLDGAVEADLSPAGETSTLP